MTTPSRDANVGQAGSLNKQASRQAGKRLRHRSAVVTPLPSKSICSSQPQDAAAADESEQVRQPALEYRKWFAAAT